MAAKLVRGATPDECGSQVDGGPNCYFLSSRFRQAVNRFLACFLCVIFVRPSIGQSLSDDALKQARGAFFVINA
jgi:hypothetical protein